MKVVISTKGIFHLTSDAVQILLSQDCQGMHEEVNELAELGFTDTSLYPPFGNKIPRNDPLLVALVEELGAKASDSSRLTVIDIPNDVGWYVRQFEDGSEIICEMHRMWFIDDYGNQGMQIPKSDAMQYPDATWSYRRSTT